MTVSMCIRHRQPYCCLPKILKCVSLSAACRSPGSCGPYSEACNRCKSAPTAFSVPSCSSSSCSSSSSSPSPPASGAWASCWASSCSCCTSSSWCWASCWRTRSSPVRCPSEDLSRAYFLSLVTTTITADTAILMSAIALTDPCDPLPQE